MDVVPATQVGDTVRRKISSVFVDGFYFGLTLFSKDRARLGRAFEHMFLPDRFFVAVEDDKVVAIGRGPERPLGFEVDRGDG